MAIQYSMSLSTFFGFGLFFCSFIAFGLYLRRRARRADVKKSASRKAGSGWMQLVGFGSVMRSIFLYFSMRRIELTEEAFVVRNLVSKTRMPFEEISDVSLSSRTAGKPGKNSGRRTTHWKFRLRDGSVKNFNFWLTLERRDEDQVIQWLKDHDVSVHDGRRPRWY